MISKLSEYCTDHLIAEQYVKKDEREIYIYGFYMLISRLTFFLFAIIFGALIGCCIESIIFYITFQVIRRFAGGYHASTESRCNILSAFFIIICISFVCFAQRNNLQAIMLGVYLLSAIVILILCPIDTPEKPLSEKEYSTFKKISFGIVFLYTLLILVAFSLKWEKIFFSICVSLLLESILLLLGKVKALNIAKLS